MSVLFLVACSLTKASGGTASYDREATIAADVPRHAERLVARRDEVRERVKNGMTTDWQGVPLKDLAYNRGLAKGSEFAGRRNSAYMPALDRYEGRFFQALGDAGKTLCKSNDSTLIISGLYGLLRGSEPMQLYSCPLSAEVARIWRRDGLLTEILRAYIVRHNVLRVFDLTSMEAYRRLIDWDCVAADRTDVLHCFDSMAAGESALTSFGRLFRFLLSLGDEELIGLDPAHPPREFGTCCLRRRPQRLPRLSQPSCEWR